jgi:hypothetical protein
MIIRHVLALSGLALVLSTGPSHAGPCTQQIDDVRSAVGQKLNDIAAAEPAAGESTAATMHRQPTPRSVGQAEGRPEKEVQTFEQAMARAP